MTVAAIIQPHFLPFAGYFDLMQRADVFVYYDTVQFCRRSWHCRTWLRQGCDANLFSAPVCVAGGSRRPLAEMAWDDKQSWRARLLRRLRHVYGERVPPWLQLAIEEGPSGLVDWNVLTSDAIARTLGIRTRTMRASDLCVPPGDKQARLISICREIRASRYVCGPGSRSYVRDQDFEEANIEIEWVEYDYSHRLPKPGGQMVWPSILDLMMTQDEPRTQLEVGLLTARHDAAEQEETP